MITIMSTLFVDLLSTLPSTSLTLPQGAHLFERDDPVRHVHAVVRGEVHLLRRQADGAAFVLQRAGPGALLAEASILSARFHCAAECVTAADITRWPREDVRQLIATSHAVTEAYAAHLAAEVHAARARAEIVSLRRVADRLDAWLAWQDGRLPGKGQWQGLARELNVTPEALYRELARRRQA
ncbi:MAG: hypothetical protein AUK37_01885 [Rhodobacterales bacterium CG2_30_65_12]|nr:MAG: hypothetical protein AUK37_01885 [Rhodobacterales bacterium CG2_30_65_12]